MNLGPAPAGLFLASSLTWTGLSWLATRRRVSLRAFPMEYAVTAGFLLAVVAGSFAAVILGGYGIVHLIVSAL